MRFAGSVVRVGLEEVNEASWDWAQRYINQRAHFSPEQAYDMYTAPLRL
jgi:hypothetical protein